MGRATTSCQVIAQVRPVGGVDEDVHGGLGQRARAARVVRVAVGDDDAPKLRGVATVGGDGARDPQLRAGIAAVDQRQLGLEDEVGLDPGELDLGHVAHGL